MGFGGQRVKGKFELLLAEDKGGEVVEGETEGLENDRERADQELSAADPIRESFKVYGSFSLH